MWLKGARTTTVLRDARRSCSATSPPDTDGIRAAYVPDATTGTLWFADKAVWVADGDRSCCPSSPRPRAQAYVAGTTAARVITYADALERAS